MSRVGQVPIVVPDGVSVEISGQLVTTKGKQGELSRTLMPEVEISRDGDQIIVKPRDDGLRARKMWGTARSLLNSMVKGVAEGFTRNLLIQGVGYRAQVQGKELIMQLGFSHEIRYRIADGIKIECPDQTHINVSGADKQRVGQVAAEVRAFRPPEPYKGKGIRYVDEYVRRKEGKKK